MLTTASRALLIIAASFAATPVFAQSDTTRLPSLYVGGGVTQFDLGGTGTAPLFVTRADWTWRRHFLVEAGVAVARPEQTSTKTTLLIPEGQLQGQLRFGNLFPYVGVGAGFAFDVRDEAFGGWDTEPTLSVAGGARLWFKRWLALRGELRVRGIGTGFEGATAEWSGGLAWRFR